MATLAITDNETSGLNISLLDHANIITISPSPKMGLSPDDPLATTTLYLLVNGSTERIARDNLADVIDALDDAMDWWTNLHRYKPIFLAAGADTEGVKRFLIKSYELRFEADEFVSILQEVETTNGTMLATLAITHLRDWEGVASNYIVTNRSALGGWWDLDWAGANTSGRVPFRPAELVFSSSSDIDRFWIGVRPINNGSAGFNPLLELTAGTKLTDTTSVADANGTNNTTCQITFATASMAKRIEFILLTHTGVGATNFPNYFGDYLLLLRYRYSNTSTLAAVRVGTAFRSYADNPPTAYQATTYLENNGTAYFMAPVGNVSIPPYKNYVGSLGSKSNWNPLQFRFFVEAERISGTGYLYLDSIVLMPSTHLIHWDNVDCSSAEWVHVFQLENLDTLAIVTDQSSKGSPANVGIPSATNWGIPPEGSLMVFCVERAAAQNKSDLIDPQLFLVKRGHSFNA